MKSVNNKQKKENLILFNKTTEEYIKDFNKQKINSTDGLYIFFSRIFVVTSEKRKTISNPIIFPIYSMPDKKREIDVGVNAGAYLGRKYGNKLKMIFFPKFSKIVSVDRNSNEEKTFDDILIFYGVSFWGDVSIRAFRVILEKNGTYSIKKEIDLLGDCDIKHESFNMFNKERCVHEDVLENMYFSFRSESLNYVKVVLDKK